VTLTRALRTGFLRAFARLWPALSLWGAAACEVLAGTALGLLALHAVSASGDRRIASAGAAGLLAAWLAARVARAVVLAGALTASAAALEGRPEPAAGAALFGTAGRALGYFAVSSALALFSRLWVWTALLATGWSFLSTLGRGAAAVAPSLGLAVTLGVSLPLGLLLGLWADAALARSAGRGEPYGQALLRAAEALWRRPWAPLGVVVITGALRWTADVSVSSIAGLAAPVTLSGEASPAALGARIAGGLLVALAAAICELVRVIGLQALDLAPAPAPPGPVLAAPVQAEPILMASPVDAPGSGG
jgi:hypothetical protein